MRCAVATYRSSRSGDVFSEAALLSKPKLAPSLGSQSVTSMSSASRSRMAFAYSLRFKRCITYRPGLLRPSQARSSDPASQLVKPRYSPSVGCGTPWGGIARAPSLRSTRSHVSACGNTSSRLADSRLTGDSAGDAVRLLWQPTQFLFNHVRYFAASAACDGDDCEDCTAGDCARAGVAGRARVPVPACASTIAVPAQTSAALVTHRLCARCLPSWWRTEQLNRIIPLFRKSQYSRYWILVTGRIAVQHVSEPPAGSRCFARHRPFS
jgi:hypothetical protein